MNRLAFFGLVSILAATTACGPQEEPLEEEWVDDGGSADSWAGGIPDPGDNVWEVRNQWTDTAPNGETYEQFYGTWLSNIQHDGNGRAVQYTMADGTVFPAPSLECADSALFLRFLFASEYSLPMFVGGGGQYFGHFGWVRRDGSRVRRYSGEMYGERGSDTSLQASNRYLPDNLQSYPHDGATIGTYLDAVLRNKRLGYFLQDLWNMIYSGNLAENINSFYVRPEHVREGDLQLHRYAGGGIGHTITIQRVDGSDTGRLVRVDVIQSYMPTLPWIGDGYSELTSYTPDPSTHGGLRRWRRPARRNGRWYLVADEEVAAWDSEVVNNPERFQELFNMSAEDEVSAMVVSIDTRRELLFDNPNSCRRREEREEAFHNLYQFYQRSEELWRSLGFETQPTVEAVRPAVDRHHRTIDDFIWSRLDYETARTCHWNPSNAQINNDMYRATVEFNRALLTTHGCEGLRVFRAEGAEYCAGRDGASPSNPGSCASVPDGFQDLRSFATDNGYGWADYLNDEAGSLSGVTTDGLADPATVTYFCQLFDSLSYWTQPSR